MFKVFLKVAREMVQQVNVLAKFDDLNSIPRRHTVEEN